MAIGFHRRAAVAHGFNPVLYTVDRSGILKALHISLAELDRVSGSRGWTMPASIASDLEDVKCEHGHPVDLESVKSEVEEMGDYVAAAAHRLQQVLAFVKTFEEKQFDTIYCEREWRSSTEFSFELTDVAMVVLPRRGDSPSYFQRFISECQPRLGLPLSVPVVPWEDLVEH